MKKNYFLLFVLLFSFVSIGFGQMKPEIQARAQQATSNYQLENLSQLQGLERSVPTAPNPFLGMQTFNYQPLPSMAPPKWTGKKVELYRSKAGMPIMIKGEVEYQAQQLSDRSTEENECLGYLESIKNMIQVENPADEFMLKSFVQDDNGDTHYRLQQTYQGLEVYGAEVMLHQRSGKINLFNGRNYPTVELSSIEPQIDQATAESIMEEHLGAYTRIKALTSQEQHWLGREAVESQLVVFHPNQELQQAQLAWAIDIFPNITNHWVYFVDAQTGAIIHHFSKVCQIHAGSCNHHDHALETDSRIPMAPTSVLPPDGPATATATDLSGVNRLINTYETNNNFFMIDASRQMFNANESSFPNEAVGVIMTIDADNTSPQNDDFSTFHVTSSNNNWNNPTAVSAHYNAGEVYEYFRQTFNRNSINGTGGNVISFINVSDQSGEDMDNAFWNGAFMFYGNGNTSFSSPLAKSKDVAGHEVTHGVITNTANLEYYGESGAINESMADVFGVMIDREDWLLGEDVVNPSVFPSGALRDMLNPNNGGSQLGHPGWQPDHVSDQYDGPQDNNGVHINSGIANKAFALFANEIGKDKAEQVYYRALTTYLVRSSQFVDLRIAVLQSAEDLYGNTEVNAAASAFDAVGIVGSTGGDYEEEVEENPGDEYILFSDGDLSSLILYTPDGTEVADPLSTVAPLSKPSITDDGSLIFYIATDKTMRFITIDWAGGTFNSGTLSNEPVWRNVAVSKDGNRLAALTDDYDNRLIVFDISQLPGNAPGLEFELYNPTYAEGVETGAVVFADVLEWDFTGEFIMYDALNRVESNFGDLEYWDIGFIRGWSNGSNDFGDGFVSKLFSGLPENTSVGNPSFSKTASFIIAFDVLDEFEEEYYVQAANIETGEVGLIFQNAFLGYPNYSTDDSRIIFDATTDFTDRVIAVSPLAEDKINSSDDPSVFLDGGFFGARWGTWFANGDRPLVDTEDLELAGRSLSVYPNPATDQITIELELEQRQKVGVAIYDLLGRNLINQEFEANAGTWKEVIATKRLESGTYDLQLRAAGSSESVKVVVSK